jgi:hypothetical protein
MGGYLIRSIVRVKNRGSEQWGMKPARMKQDGLRRHIPLSGLSSLGLTCLIASL